ncbi:MAG: hypothetical protein GTO14_19900 [Anaerolineales bacterium]|nr:hypothetical protein [Anaerolineales bacterium]
MKIKRQKLIELAFRETERRAAQNDVISGYLIGSVAAGNPNLGDTLDIDLILIHENAPDTQREIIRLSDQIHLDIFHHWRDLYSRPRDLRIHPWLGPAMSAPIFLYDPQHFFEWAQAGARGQFFRSDHVYARAYAFLKRARQAKSILPISGRWLKTYLRAALEATNALISLTSAPAAGRRVMLDLERCARTSGHADVYSSFLRLLGEDQFNAAHLPEWLSAWGLAFDEASALSGEPDLSECRRMYYLRGFQALAESGRPEAALWTMLTTWEGAMHALDHNESAGRHQPPWEAVLKRLRLSLASKDSRAEELERHLDTIEGLLDTWAVQNGV